MYFGEILKQIRENSNLTRDDLANKLNISYSTISRYETNVRFPDREMLCKIADFFHVSINYLLGRTNIRKPINNHGKKSKENVSTNDELSNQMHNLSLESQKDLKKYIKLLELNVPIVFDNFFFNILIFYFLCGSYFFY